MTPPERTTIRIHDDLSLELSSAERRRLLIRVMCELVAYGEEAIELDDPSTADRGRPPTASTQV